MNFLATHGPNLGSDDPSGPTPILYDLRVVFGLPVVTLLARYVSPLLSFALLVATIVVWARYWYVHPWTQYFVPEEYQSDFVAAGRWDKLMDLRVDTSKYIAIKNPKFNRFKSRKIPLFVFIEAYRVGDIAIVGDMPFVMSHKDEWCYNAMDWEYLHFIIFGYVLDIFVHSRHQDNKQVTEHYNTGNDLFGWFLGHRMVYTCGYYLDFTESLEKAQDQKMQLVAQKIDLKPGMRVLDLGSGWGTWTLWSASKIGTHTTGLSIAKEQINFAKERAEKNKIKNVDWLLSDYRDMPQGKPRFDRVTCFEMAEHVGVKRFPAFLQQVWDALEDGGIFYLQIAGLREKWQYDDVSWGIFMYRYIFRGADASLPLNWVVGQLERAGFEINSVENVGFHYIQTIKQWRENLVKNKAEIEKAYSAELYRIYDLFLGWTPCLGEHGMSTCWQIVCYKNLDTFNRKKTFNGVLPKAYKLNISFDDLQ
jgi:cyclopropane fatty-acyl-phospholipid synthase-like methyltransferase